jgi:Protein of unknown function (DUF2934)
MATFRRTQTPQTSAKPGATTKATPTSQVGGAPLREKIAERAYAIWQASGRPNGRDQEHWLQAERELNVGKQ